MNLRGNKLYTEPIPELGNCTLAFEYPGSKDLVDTFHNLIDYILLYLASEKPAINNRESIGFGCSLLGFVKDGEKNYTIQRFSVSENKYSTDLDFALRVANEQKLLCNEHNSEFEPPSSDQKIAITKMVLEKDTPVEGVRYEAPEHMSGWYITADDYSGDIDSLQLIHAIELVEIRPDLAKFLALQSGFWFLQKNMNESQVGLHEKNA